MNIGIFFGAGAEIGYGLPSGGKFAIDLFRQDLSPHKEILRQQLQHNVDRQSTYATDWLPDRFELQRIHAFGKNEFTSLIESSIEYRKNEIIRRLNAFDQEADQAIHQLGLTRDFLAQRFMDTTGRVYGDRLYAQIVRMNPLLAGEVRLFHSEFYSAILDVVRADRNAADLQRYAASFLQLLVGAHGQHLVQRLNQEIFETAPDDLPIFDDISGMFRLEYSRVGLTALELLLEEHRNFRATPDAPISEILCAIAQKVLENIFTTVLDYQSLIDNHFRYLYSPKAEWAKFTKMVVFLRAAREYIVKQLQQAGQLPGQGYYHDLTLCGGLGMEISSIGTANYCNIVENISGEYGFQIPEVIHLNGGINDYYNPYKNTIIRSDNPENLPLNQILVPFILTQSGLKPLTSVHMSKRYVQLFERFAQSDAIVVVGYRFNIDDTHINGLFRELVEDFSKKLYWICLDTSGPPDDLQREAAKRLRVAANYRGNIHVVPVDRHSRKQNDKLWLEVIRDHLENA